MRPPSRDRKNGAFGKRWLLILSAGKPFMWHRLERPDKHTHSDVMTSCQDSTRPRVSAVAIAASCLWLVCVMVIQEVYSLSQEGKLPMTSAHTKTANYTLQGFIIMRFISVTLIFHVQAPLWSKLNKDLYMRTNKKLDFYITVVGQSQKPLLGCGCVVARWSHTCPNQDPSLYKINLYYSRCLKLTILNIVHNLLFYVNL